MYDYTKLFIMESNHDSRSNQFGEATQRALKKCKKRRQQAKQAQTPAQHPEIETMPPPEVFRAYMVETVVSNLRVQELSEEEKNTLVEQLSQAHDKLRDLRDQVPSTDADDATRALELAQELEQQLRLLRHDFTGRDDLVAMAENIRGMLVSADHLADTNAILRLADLMNSSFNYIFLPPPPPMRRQMSVPSA